MNDTHSITGLLGIFWPVILYLIIGISAAVGIARANRRR